MAVKPTGSTEWASDATALKVEPSADQRQWGWSTSDNTINGDPVKPNLQNQNQWNFNADAMLDYINSYLENDPDWVDYWSVGSNSQAVTSADVDDSADTFTITGHGYRTGTEGFITTATPANRPSPLADFTTYYFIVIDEDTFQVATTLQNALDGVQIDLTDTGGNHDWSITPHFYLPEDWNYKLLSIKTDEATPRVVLPDISTLTNTRKEVNVSLTEDSKAKVEISGLDTTSADQTFSILRGLPQNLELYRPSDFVNLRANPNIIGVRDAENVYQWDVLGLRTDQRYRGSIDGGARTVAAAKVNVTDNSMELNAGTYLTGEKVQFTTTGTLPTGLSLATDYWVLNISSECVRVADSLSNLSANIAVDLTTQGTGTHTLTPTGDFHVLPSFPYDQLEVDTSSIDYVIVLNQVQQLQIYKVPSTGVLEIDPDTSTIRGDSTHAYLHTARSTANLYRDGSVYELDYEEAEITPGGAFTGTVLFSRNRSEVTFIGSLTHAAAHTPIGAAGSIPARFRPISPGFQNLHAYDGSRIYFSSINTAGTLTAQYRSFSGTLDSTVTGTSWMAGTYIGG
jgi:hypothetical protein